MCRYLRESRPHTKDLQAPERYNFRAIYMNLRGLKGIICCYLRESRPLCTDLQILWGQHAKAWRGQFVVAQTCRSLKGIICCYLRESRLLCIVLQRSEKHNLSPFARVWPSYLQRPERHKLLFFTWSSSSLHRLAEAWKAEFVAIYLSLAPLCIDLRKPDTCTIFEIFHMCHGFGYYYWKIDHK